MGAILSKEKKHGHDKREKGNQEVGENEEGKEVAGGQAAYGDGQFEVRQTHRRVYTAELGVLGKLML